MVSHIRWLTATHDTRDCALRDDICQPFMRKTVFPYILNRHGHWLRPCDKMLLCLIETDWLEARRICNTTATISNPPPTHQASNELATTTAEHASAESVDSHSLLFFSLQYMPSERGACFVMCRDWLPPIKSPDVHAWI